MKLTKKEIENVSSLNPQLRYKYLIKRVADSELLFTLKDSKGQFLITEVEGNKLFSIWSSKEFASNCIQGDWINYNPSEITLEQFQEEVIDFLEENNFLINVFSVGNKSGFVVNILEFAQDLSKELNNY